MEPGGSGTGNTISVPRVRCNPAKRWHFVLNNYKEEDLCSIGSTIESKCRYGCYGLEKGLKGTPHVQGYLEFREKRRPLSVFKNKRIHWEVARGSKIENIEYCSKENLTYEFPERYKMDLELRPWQDKIVKLLKAKPDDRTIIWVWEPEGCKGKTCLQKYIYGHLDGCVILAGKNSDMKNGVSKYFEATSKLPKIVLINIPRRKLGGVSYIGIEEVKDMIFYSPKYEGCMICGACPHVVIFANDEPDYEALSSDRWNVIRIAELDGGP